MKKNISRVIITIILLGGILLLAIFFSYEESDKFFDFPIPKDAELVSDKEGVTVYNWSKASEENGIPYIYKQIIKSKGWSKVDREGASTYYKKDEHRIDLISQTKRLTLRIEQ